jgi:GH24 family phage-related lysozyme (muramidase)
MRRVTPEGIKELEQMEAVEPYVYPDQAGYQSIGVGHKLTQHELETGLLLIDSHAVRWLDGLTPEQIDGLMRADLAAAEWTVESCVTVPLTDNQFTALVSLAFNIGSTAFKNSSVVRVLNEGNYHLVPGFMRLWNKITVDGKKVVSQGLVHRRESEIKIWLKP